MKTSPLLYGCLAVALALTLVVSGCGKKSTSSAAVSLEQSFQQATPETQQAIQQVAAELRAGNIPQAVRLLIPVLESRKLTEAQQQAVGATLKQINDAIVADPSLETSEMYQMRQKLFRSVYGQGGL